MRMEEPLRPRDHARSVDIPVRPRELDDLTFTRHPAVRWFSPGVLTESGLRVLISAAFGSYLDKRELQAAIPADSFDHRSTEPEVWFDFLADTGDGFNATYTIAWLASQAGLAVEGLAEPLPRASLLVLGGDQVYPSGTPEAYDDRFVGPFQAALPWVPESPPDLVALAGNHDWYDGLSSFVRLFCQGRWIGSRRTHQSRSYFAVLLPHRWWLWGIDIQFDAYLDEPQIAYFEKVLVADSEPGDRIILCTGKPSWTALREDPAACRNLNYLERIIRGNGCELALTLTGDHHHYARYSSEGGHHKITSGGGGAFLHPTHDLAGEFTVKIEGAREPIPPETFTREARYPDSRRSRLLSAGALALPIRNPSFMTVPAVVYILLAWASQFGIRALDEAQRLPLDQVADGFGFRDLALGLIRNPNSVVLALVFLIGLIAFAKPGARFASGRRALVARVLMGTVHASMHLGAFLLVNLIAIDLAGFADAGWYTWWLFVFTGVLGGVAGGLVMGLYLAVSIALPGWEAHANEAFSACRMTCFKNFLRLHIDRDGQLRIYPIGVDRSVLRWETDPDNPDQSAPWLKPKRDSPRAHLIEGPIVVGGIGGRRRD